MNEKIGRCHDCTAPQTEVNILSRHILELQKDKGELIDSVRDLEEKLANADYQLEGRDLEVKGLQKENAELKEKLTAIRNAKDKYDMSKDKSIIKAFGAEYTLFCDLERILEDWYEDDKLTEATKLIKIMSRLLFDVCGYINIPFEKKVKDFLSEVGK